ncbi:MAG: DUF4956 domain-containing protein [Gammaproteobacteria bacterium]|nr:DUF4956 domain-containing protein [Gammaproteobacteria bacterium]
MRRSSRASAALFVITSYYVFFLAGFWLVTDYYPGLDEYMPVGGIEELIERGGSSFEPVEIIRTAIVQAPHMTRLALAMIGATVLMLPISWIYFITTQRRGVDRSFAQTMMVLPIIVAGIAMIVQNSIPLAFSLAGIVAAVRFRFTLTQPSHTLYVFAAITIGLGAGISALEISAVISIAFVYATILMWMFDYGADLNNRFFSFLTGRDHRDDDL